MSKLEGSSQSQKKLQEEYKKNLVEIGIMCFYSYYKQSRVVEKLQQTFEKDLEENKPDEQLKKTQGIFQPFGENC